MKKQVLLATVVCAITIIMVVFISSATTPSGFTAYKLWNTQITVTDPTVSVDSLSFGFNDTSMQYDNVTFQIRNAGSQPANVTAIINLYAADNVSIAKALGSIYNIPAQTVTPLSIGFQWVNGTTVSDVVSGNIILDEQPS